MRPKANELSEDSLARGEDSFDTVGFFHIGTGKGWLMLVVACSYIGMILEAVGSRHLGADGAG